MDKGFDDETPRQGKDFYNSRKLKKVGTIY